MEKFVYDRNTKQENPSTNLDNLYFNLKNKRKYFVFLLDDLLDINIRSKAQALPFPPDFRTIRNDK